MTPLTSFLAMFLKGRLEASLTSPVLLFEPREVPSAKERDYQFRTASGAGTPDPGDGDDLVLEVKKQKNNAFQRGITLGRTGNNDLVVEDGSVSRFHAWFQVDAETGQWSVADAGSKNGTRLGRSRLAPKKLTPLKSGERLRFGKVDARFLLPPEFGKLIQAKLG